MTRSNGPRPAARRAQMRSHRLFHSFRLLSVLTLAVLPGLVLLTGCGGGGGGNSNPNPGGGGGGNTKSVVSGTITDITGSAIVGAQVTLGDFTTTSTQFGTYSIPNVGSGVVGPIVATATIGGHPWSGQNSIEVLSNQPVTSDVHIVISDNTTQGALSGTVRNAQGIPLPGAKVFAGVLAGQGTFFTNLSSIHAVADATGTYTLSRLPAGTYTVTASFAGYLNQTVSNVAITAGQTSPLAFTLNRTTGASNVPVVTDLSAQSITVPATPSRAVGATANERALNAIRHFILQQRGLLNHRLADSSRITRRTMPTRATPAGSLIENDLFWDYTQIDNLFGYAILRSINSDKNFVEIALQRDPQADRFADLDSTITPDSSYYYSLARVDTINFPNNGTEGDPSAIVVTQPLGPLTLGAPAPGANAGLTPTFSWTAVSRAAKYQVIVYDRFPNYQSDTDPNGVAPIWPADPNNPGGSLVNAPATSLVYSGPALTPGHTYYWTVIGSDTPNSAFTVGQISSFVAQ